MSNLENPSVQRVCSALTQAGSPSEVIELSETARSAQDAAVSIGTELGSIVKSLVFAVAGKPVMALVAGGAAGGERGEGWVDVAPLADMVLMEKLYIENNRVTKLEPLVKLVALKKFLARGNSIPSRQSTMLSKALPNCNEFKAGVFSTIPPRRRPSIPKDK